MNWLDVFIILFLLAAIIRGSEVGFIRQICSGVGFFGGLFLGAWLEGKLIGLISSPNARAIFALLVTLGCAVALMLVGEYVGIFLKFRLNEGRLASRLDKIFGSTLAVVSLLAGIWLAAAIFRGLPSGLWQRQIRSSSIIAVLNSHLPSAPQVLTKLGHLIDPNGFPQVFAGLEPSVKSDAPLPDMGELNAAVQKSQAAVVRIEGEGCGGIVQGTGFIAAKNEVITNAHVVAGVRNPVIISTQGRFTTSVEWFDPEIDLAVLRTRGLEAGALKLLDKDAQGGTPAAIAGYPGGRGFQAGPAVILESFTAIGHDIYNHGRTERQVYSLKGDVEEGNSGGPLINKDGSVIGVVFAKSITYDHVAYALNSDQAIAALNQAHQTDGSVDTGSCAQ